MSQFAIIFASPNGNVAVSYPTGEILISEVKKKHTPENSVVVSVSELPSHNDDFFDCWELAGNSIVINLEKAKEQCKNKLRRERVPLLEALDVSFQRALEDGTSTTDIVNEKRRLRDITLLANQATTINQLRSLECSSLSLVEAVSDEPAYFTPIDLSLFEN